MGALGFGHELALGRWRAGMAPAFEFAAGGLPPGASLTRASSGRRWNASGVSVAEAADIARFDYDPVTLAYRGLLIEGARTNLLPWSADLDNAVWTPTRGSVTANAGIAPDGNAAADKFVPNTTANTHYVTQTFAFTSGLAYVFTHFLKAAGYRYGRISLPSGAFPSASRAAVFDLQTGTITATDSGVTATIENAGGGWYRCTLIQTAIASASGIVGSAVNQTGAAALESWAANGSDGILTWGAQLEAAAASSSHIPTGITSGTRAADALVLDWGSRGVGNGAATVRCTFDDGSTQDVGVTIAAGTAALPSGLNRAWLRRVEKI